jgi:hypothetical protein
VCYFILSFFLRENNWFDRISLHQISALVSSAAASAVKLISICLVGFVTFVSGQCFCLDSGVYVGLLFVDL